MPLKDKIDNVDSLDPAKRAAFGIGVVAGGDETTEEVVVVDDRLKEHDEEQKKEKERLEREKQELVLSSDEIAAAPLVVKDTNRELPRVLILTRDASLLQEDILQYEHMKHLMDLFAEVHVVVLSVQRKRRTETNRISENAWVYTTDSRSLRRTITDAGNIAKKQLVFGDGFRPDIIIAEDPFECAVAGRKIAKKYDRPFQIHISDDFFDPSFVEIDKKNKWRLRLAKRNLKRTACVRTRSEYLKKHIEESYTHLKDQVEVLPHYYNVREWHDAEGSINFKEKYPTFRFVILHVTQMTERSHSDRAINGVMRILKKYKTVGMIIIGDGPMKDMLKEHVEKFDVQGQIIFEPDTSDVVSYMKGTNVLVYTSENTEEEKALIQAASSRLPIVSCKCGIVTELFVDKESAILCPIDNPACLGRGVNTLLSDITLRKKISENAYDLVLERIEQDYDRFLESYRASVERCVISDS